MKPKKILLPVIGEAGLILAIGAIGWAAHMPLLFTSLGPTAYELVEKPKSPSAKAYNVIVGHFIALAVGFFALWLLHAWNAPKVSASGFVASPRLWAAVVAVALTTLLTLLLKASQPAALATTLLVALGSMQRAQDAIAIVIGVLILAIIGVPIRRQFEKLAPEG
jgi:hypothetical protein